MNGRKIPKSLAVETYSKLILILTAAYLIVLYCIHNHYLDSLIGSFIYIMLTVAAMLYLPGILTKILCAAGLSICITYLIYVINPALFLALCFLLLIAGLFFIIFCISSFKLILKYGIRGLAIGFGIGVGGYAGYKIAENTHNKYKRKRRRKISNSKTHHKKIN